MSGKHRNLRSAQDTRWCILMKDGAAVRCTGRLMVTRKRTALVCHECEDGRQFLVFGCVSRLIESIEAIEADNEQ